MERRRIMIFDNFIDNEYDLIMLKERRWSCFLLMEKIIIKIDQSDERN